MRWSEYGERKLTLIPLSSPSLSAAAKVAATPSPARPPIVLILELRSLRMAALAVTLGILLEISTVGTYVAASNLILNRTDWAFCSGLMRMCLQSMHRFVFLD